MSSKIFKLFTKHFSAFKVYHKKSLNALHNNKTRFMQQNVLYFFII